MEKLTILKNAIVRRVIVIGAMVSVLALAAVPAFATPTHAESVGGVFEGAIDDFVGMVLDLVPYLFAGLVVVLLIRLAIRWFSRVTNSV